MITTLSRVRLSSALLLANKMRPSQLLGPIPFGPKQFSNDIRPHFRAYTSSAYVDDQDARAKVFINEEIAFPTLRIIDEKGFVGDMPKEEGLQLAKERGVDLVLLNGAKVPPICKLIPVAEHIQQINDKMARVKDTSTEASQYSFPPNGKVRTMSFSVVEQDHDLLRKIGWARESLKKGHRVEIDLQKRSGSANQAAERALRIVSELKDCCKPVGLPVDIAAYAKNSVAFNLWPCTPEQAAAFKLPVIKMTLAVDDVSVEKRSKMDSTRIRKTKDYRGR